MAERRDVIRFGAALFTAGPEIGLSGCVSDGSDESGGAETDAEMANEHYESALDLLEENADRLDEFAESESTPDTFDETAIRRRADSAEEELDEAESYATDDQIDSIENARAIATYQREAARYNALYVDFFNCLDAVTAYIDSNRWDDAADHVSECRDVVGDLESQWRDVDAAHSEIDSDLLTSEGQLEYGDTGDDLNVERDSLDVLETFMDGFVQFLDAMPDFEEGSNHLQEEEYESAAEKFGDAERTFHASADTFERLEEDDDTPEHLMSDVIEMRCYADALGEASGHYADSAEAADRGDWNTAEQRAEDGEEALDRCG